MAHTVTGLIRRAPHIAEGSNSNGTYTMFCFELSEFSKGFNGTEDSYTNYSIALFAKTPAAVDFHLGAIMENSFVVVDCDKLVIDKQTGNDGKEYIKLKMMNARLSGFNAPQNGQPQAPQQSPQGFAPQQQMQQTQGFQPQQQAQGFQPQQQAPQQQMQQAPQQPGFNQQQPKPNQYNR